MKDKNGLEIKVGQKIKSCNSIGEVIQVRGKLGIKFDCMPDAFEVILRPERLEIV